MKNRSVWSVCIALVMVFVLAGCHAEEKMDEAVYGTLDKVQELGDPGYSSYQDILDAYSAKLEKKGKTLEKELLKEAPARYKKDGTLAILLKEKTNELNEVYQEGLGKLSQYSFTSGESEEILSDQTDTLYTAYRQAEDGIMDAYTEALGNVQ